jgi:hypothetical protein
VSRLFNDQVFECVFENAYADWADVVYMPEVNTLTKKQKKFYANFIHPRDSIDGNDNRITSHKDSSCWMEGYISRKEFTWLGNLPGIQATFVKDTVNEKEIIAQNDTVVLNVIQSHFDPSKHVVKSSEKNETYYGETIDNKEVYGTDGINGQMPVWQVDKLKLTVKGKEIEIPDDAYRNLYDPHIEDIVVSFDKRGNIYIMMDGSDGGEAYGVVWIIKNGKYLYRYIDTSND